MIQQHTLDRDGYPPLTFTGELIGEGSNAIDNGNHANRWTDVAIYKTQGGKYVAAIDRHTQWAGEKSRSSVQHFTSPKDVIKWLKEGEDHLGGVSQEAVEEACNSDPAFKEAWVEVIE